MNMVLKLPAPKKTRGFFNQPRDYQLSKRTLNKEYTENIFLNNLKTLLRYFSPWPRDNVAYISTYIYIGIKECFNQKL
jgi:hypothetical protein